MKEKLKAIQEKAMAAFQEAKEMKDIDDLKVKYLGKKGELTAILKEMGKLSAEERPIIGQMANDVRQNLEKCWMKQKYVWQLQKWHIVWKKKKSTLLCPAEQELKVINIL